MQRLTKGRRKPLYDALLKVKEGLFHIYYQATSIIMFMHACVSLLVLSC